MKLTSRRQFAADATRLAAFSMTMGTAFSQSADLSKTRLILLGTAGGPRPRKTRHPSAQVIVIKGEAYVIDCGDGVAAQLASAGVALPSLRHVFITHHHSDHNAGYGSLLLIAWASGLQRRVDTWGPPPLSRMTRLFFQLNDYDIKTRTRDEGRTPLVPLVHAHEFSKGGILIQNDDVTVRCALVDHPPVTPSFAYRFNTRDRSIVISGDTRPSDALIQLAKGADVLVHEALYPSAVDKMVAPLPNAEALKRSILSHHTPVEEAGRVAEAAGVKTLVLSHFVPAEDAAISEQMWIDAARRTFKGAVIAGRDFLEL